MGKTISEKIIARASGRTEVNPGEIVWVTPDLTACYDFPIRDLPDPREVGVPNLKNAEKTVAFIDHHTAPQLVTNEEVHIRARNWCHDFGVRLYEGMGIGHHLLVDLGLVRPGMLCAHHDTMVTGVGGIGVLGIGTLPLLEIFARGKTWIKVPESIKCNILGELPKGVMARDVIHMIVGKIGCDGALYKAVEFGGPAVTRMSIDARMTICNLANHVGAKTAIVNPDERTLEYVKNITEEPFEPVVSDSDAKYERTFDFDVSELQPYVAAPPREDNCRLLSEVEGTPINVGYIGSCAGGRIDDLRAAAKVLRGRQINPKVKLYVVPSTRMIMESAGREGLLQTFIEAGALVFPPTCDFCFGALGVMASGQTAITTGTLNLPGRMGSEESSIFLASACSVAASAVEGKVSDPRKYL